MIKYGNPKRLAYLISTALLLLMILLLIPQAAMLKDSLEALKFANHFYLIAGSITTTGTYFAAAFALKSLALKPLAYSRTLFVQVASAFTTKLVPAGIGGFALNARYLTKNKHSGVQASSVLALNGLLGFAGHIIILMTSLVFTKRTVTQTVNLSPSPLFMIVFVVLIIISLAILLSVPSMRIWLKHAVNEIWHIVRTYRHSYARMMNGFVGACFVTIFFIITLYACALSLDIELNFLQVMLVYTACAIGTAIIPTPGGIGGAEAALTAALVAVGIERSLSLSLAILFRLITYWIPIVPGIICFQYSLRKHYI